MTTPASPLTNQIPQPLLQALRDSLKGDLHFPGDQTCVAPLELPFADDRQTQTDSPPTGSRINLRFSTAPSRRKPSPWRSQRMRPMLASERYLHVMLRGSPLLIGRR